MAAQSQSNWSIGSIIWGGAIVFISAASAIALPLTTYATTLATFGFAHVAIELRYIDSRFLPQLNRKITLRLVLLVLAIATLRCGMIFGFMPIEIAQLLELCCGLGLVLLATRHLWIRDWRRGVLGIGVGCLLGIGIIADPIATLVVFAIIHNLTLVGFILERQGCEFPQMLWIGGTFGLIPCLIFLTRSIRADLPLEINDTYLHAFIAPSWAQLSIAYPLFSAVAFLQCMHYAVVIGLFAQWTPDRANSLACPNKYFYSVLGGISVLFLIAFQHSFTLTRAGYSAIASIHAWIEIPLLLIATNRQLDTSTKSQLSKTQD